MPIFQLIPNEDSLLQIAEDERNFCSVAHPNTPQYVHGMEGVRQRYIG